MLLRARWVQQVSGLVAVPLQGARLRLRAPVPAGAKTLRAQVQVRHLQPGRWQALRRVQLRVGAMPPLQVRERSVAGLLLVRAQWPVLAHRLRREPKLGLGLKPVLWPLLGYRPARAQLPEQSLALRRAQVPPHPAPLRARAPPPQPLSPHPWLLPSRPLSPRPSSAAPHRSSPPLPPRWTPR